MKARKINTEIENFNNPALLGLTYNGGELIINYTPNPMHIVNIKFKVVIGFRLLDEGDLVSYWDYKGLTQNWIVEITEGGWMDLENSTGGFTSKYHYECKEFFVMSVDDCVSVITPYEPIIENVLKR